MSNNTQQQQKKVVHTRKRKVKVLVPQLQNYIIQPNHVTNARYEYTLIQERIFTAVMFNLQKYIQQVISDKQLSFFGDLADNSRDIRIAIPLRELTSPSNYGSILAAAKKMVETSISFPRSIPNGEKVVEIHSLIRKATVPTNGKKSSRIELTISYEVAELLVSIKTLNNGKTPSEYTRFMYEVAQGADSKYTSLLYKKICSWKKKGGFKISLNELYKDICVCGVYLNKDGTVCYKNFKRLVLEKAKKELYKQADVWFEYSEEYDGKRVKNLSFKVITPETIEDLENKVNYIKMLLTQHLKLNLKDIETLKPCFVENRFDYVSFCSKIHDLVGVMNDKAIDGKSVNYPRAYIVKSLLNHFNIVESDYVEFTEDNGRASA